MILFNKWPLYRRYVADCVILNEPIFLTKEQSSTMLVPSSIRTCLYMFRASTILTGVSVHATNNDMNAFERCTVYSSLPWLKIECKHELQPKFASAVMPTSKNISQGVIDSLLVCEHMYSTGYQPCAQLHECMPTYCNDCLGRQHHHQVLLYNARNLCDNLLCRLAV